MVVVAVVVVVVLLSYLCVCFLVLLLGCCLVSAMPFSSHLFCSGCECLI